MDRIFKIINYQQQKITLRLLKSLIEIVMMFQLQPEIEINLWILPFH